LIGISGYYKGREYTAVVGYSMRLDGEQIRAFTNRIFDKLFAYDPLLEKKADDKIAQKIEGIWKSEKGGIFKLRQNGKNVTILWGIPTSDIQKDYTQIKEDVVAIEGIIEDDVVTGKYSMFYSDYAVNKCQSRRGAWKVPIRGKISQNEQVITWTRTSWSLNFDKCEFQKGEDYTSIWRRWQ
jgi:hypothetical protein